MLSPTQKESKALELLLKGYSRQAIEVELQARFYYHSKAHRQPYRAELLIDLEQAAQAQDIPF